jgi:hypothetical protein
MVADELNSRGIFSTFIFPQPLFALLPALKTFLCEPNSVAKYLRPQTRETNPHFEQFPNQKVDLFSLQRARSEFMPPNKKAACEIYSAGDVLTSTNGPCDTYQDSALAKPHSPFSPRDAASDPYRGSVVCALGKMMDGEK